MAALICLLAVAAAFGYWSAEVRHDGERSGGKVRVVGEDEQIEEISLGSAPSISQIVSTGKTIWSIIQANKPTADVKTAELNALPAGVKSWHELENWAPPSTSLHQLTLINRMGMHVVDFEYRLMFSHSGQHHGAGKYLHGVSIHVASLTVRWGFHLTVDASVPSITNLGATANPIAHATVALRWTLTSPVQRWAGTIEFFVQGDGVWKKL